MDFPAPQETHRKNLAIALYNDEVILAQHGSCWLPRTPGNLPKDSTYNESETVSLELVNNEGYFLMQKNYRFVVARGNTSKFGKSSS